jgi:hypothetical protein
MNLFFHPEEAGSRFFLNSSNFLPHYMTSHPSRQHSSEVIMHLNKNYGCTSAFNSSAHQTYFPLKNLFGKLHKLKLLNGWGMGPKHFQ